MRSVSVIQQQQQQNPFSRELIRSVIKINRFLNDFGIVADIWFEAGFGCWCDSGNQEDDDIIDEPFMRRRFFFLAVKLSWPLSVFESLSESELVESELDEDDDELELLELSDAKPVLSSKLTRAATSASGGSFSYIGIEKSFWIFHLQEFFFTFYNQTAFKSIYLQYAQPFLRELRTSTYCLMPDNWEIRFAAKILRNRNGIIQIDYNVPPSARYKNRLTGFL